MMHMHYAPTDAELNGPTHHHSLTPNRNKEIEMKTMLLTIALAAAIHVHLPGNIRLPQPMRPTLTHEHKIHPPCHIDEVCRKR